MCGRFTLTDPAKLLPEIFGVDHFPPVEPRYNIAPSQEVVSVVRERGAEAAEATMLKWGLVPFWADDPSIGHRMANARSESAAEKPAFKQAFRRRRCLVPADGFYEWQAAEGKSPKLPWFIHLTDRSAFALGGIWERWHPDAPEAIRSCAILTTAPNDLMQQIHDRMPVILPPEAFDAWLDPEAPLEYVQGLCRPFTASEMAAARVGTWVNSPKNEGEACLQWE